MKPGELIEQFLNFLLKVKKYSPNTLLAYRKDLKSFFIFLKKYYKTETLSFSLLENLSKKSILYWLLEMKVSDRTRARKLSSVKSFYKYLKNNKFITKNPVAGIGTPKYGKKLPEYLSEKQLSEMLDTPQQEKNYSSLRNHLLLELLYGCGLRRSEVINLAWENIEIQNPQTGFITLTGKGNKMRKIPLTPHLIRLLSEYANFCKQNNIPVFNTHLFLTDKYRPLYPKFIYNLVKKHAPGISPHSLRHSYATHLINAGADIQEVKELLGHSSLAATQTYLHITKKRLKEIYKKAHPRN